MPHPADTQTQLLWHTRQGELLDRKLAFRWLVEHNLLKVQGATRFIPRTYNINDLLADLNLTVWLFADETTVYLVVVTPHDADRLQADLTTLKKWEDQWKTKFHADKCIVMTVTNKRKPLHTEYNLHSHILFRMTSAKYLGSHCYWWH